jgi:prepilin-type N-terminal cleavage/methylation domain-containing protein
MMKNNDFSREGFTLLEVLIVTGILVLVSATALPFFRGFQTEADLNNNAQEVVEVLRLAYSKTVASESASSWGVYFDPSSLPARYILFKGPSYSQREIGSDQIYQLSKKIEFSQISLAGTGSEVVFERISGATQNIGSLTLRIKTESSKTRTIYVTSSGRSQIAFGTPSPPPIYDPRGFRHVHLDYSRVVAVVSEKINLIFLYDSSQIIKEIPLADYTKNNEFSWEGEVTVAGSVQKLRVHTHRLNNPDTQFCIHRDPSQNNKVLLVDLSGDTAPSPDLIRYSADGLSVTKGNSPFVSDPLPQ